MAFSHIPRGLQIAFVACAVLLLLAAGCLLLVARTFTGRYPGGAHPESGLVQLAGGPVRYVDEGNPSHLPPLLLLHGYQGTLSQWDATWAELQSCAVRRIRIDVPGFGHSVWESSDFSLDTQADRVVAFLDAMRIDRVTLAGTSMGGSLAAAVAARHPQRVAQLALFAPSAYPGSLTYDGLFGVLVKPGRPNRVATWIADSWPFRMLFPTNVAVETLTLTASYDEHWADSLHDIRAPTLIAWSTSDGTANPVAAPKVRAAIAGSTLLMLDEGTGHSIPGARPELTAALLCELANGVPVQSVMTDVVSRLLRAGEGLLPGPDPVHGDAGAVE